MERDSTSPTRSIVAGTVTVLACVGFSCGAALTFAALGSVHVPLPREARPVLVAVFFTSLFTGVFAAAGFALGSAGALAFHLSRRRVPPAPAALALGLFATACAVGGLLYNVYYLPAFGSPTSLAGNAAFVTLAGMTSLVAYRLLARSRPLARLDRVPRWPAVAAIVFAAAGTVTVAALRPARSAPDHAPRYQSSPAPPPSAADAGGNGLSVVLITIDALRPDHLGSYGYAGQTSPAIDALAASGTVFDDCIAQAPNTHPSLASLLTSRNVNAFPRRVGKGFIAPALSMLPEILERQGYSTAAVVANPWLNPDWGFGRGFEAYHEMAGASATADALTDRALLAIDAAGARPFFVWLHYLDPHHPYGAPTGDAGGGCEGPTGQADFLQAIFEGRATASRCEMKRIVAAYDGEIRFTDREVGRLLEGVSARGLLDRTLVVLTADHGEEFLDHGRVLHGHSVSRELVHVPLIWSLPGAVPAGRRVSPQVRSIDIAPTVLETLDLPSDPGFEGRSLAPLLRGDAPGAPDPAFSEKLHHDQFGGPSLLAVRADGRLLIVPVMRPYLFGYEPRGVLELWKESLMLALSWRTKTFNTAADPAEKTPVDLEPALRRRLAALARRYYGAWSIDLPGRDEGPRDDDRLRALRALGYE